MSSDAHDRMIHAFQEYFKWQDRFHHKKSNEAGIKATIMAIRNTHRGINNKSRNTRQTQGTTRIQKRHERQEALTN
jgi:hypothetical protein